MKEDTSKKGEELLEIDETGNPIKKKEGEKPNKSSKMNKLFYLSPILVIIIILLIVFLMNSGKSIHKKNVFDKTTIKNLRLKNRIISAAIFDSFLEDGKISEKD